MWTCILSPESRLRHTNTIYVILYSTYLQKHFTQACGLQTFLISTKIGGKKFRSNYFLGTQQKNGKKCRPNSKPKIDRNSKIFFKKNNSIISAQVSTVSIIPTNNYVLSFIWTHKVILSKKITELAVFLRN